ncbi:VOC family protein [Luteimonas abyssi]|uniref:VOC family protein n=1 Tax=Luteimonas abyssi TaxID=1247514 RepID=UPI000737B4BA|nr:VOC family protein [Luteimonas abyssi]
MRRRLALTTVVVDDYDRAIAWFTDCLGLVLLEDTRLPDGKRWVRIGSPGGGCGLLLAQANGEAQQARIGDQTGGRVAFFLETDNFLRDHSVMTSRGVRFLEEPRTEAYGTVAVFEDLYGNRWDLLEPVR